MNDFKTRQKQEALKRMKKLKLMKNVIDEFKNNDILYYSEDVGFKGILYWVSNKQEFVDSIKKFEERTNNLVYHAQVVNMLGHEALSLLFVSSKESEWEQENEDLDINEPCVYCDVIGDDSLSEYGCIGIECANGGISRTY